MGFIDVKNERIAKAEAMYLAGVASGNKEQQYDAIGELMAYGAITKDDDRFIKFAKETKNTDIWFDRDLRKSCYFNCKWVHADYPGSMQTVVSTKSHTGKRIEGNYEGDVQVNARDMKLVLNEVKITTAVKKLQEELNKIIQKSSTPNLRVGDGFVNNVMIGDILTYSIDTPDNFLKKQFGYVVVVKQKSGNLGVTIFVNKENMQTVHLNVKETTAAIKSLITEEFGKYTDLKLKFTVV